MIIFYPVICNILKKSNFILYNYLMPTYEYTCEKCRKSFEIARSIEDRDKSINCMHCQSKQTKRSLSTFFAHGETGTITKTQSNCSDCAGKNCSCCG